MFDRIDRSTNVHFPDTIEVKRAPTDESVRLLREMEEKALGQVLSSFTPESNEFRYTIVEMAASPFGGADLYAMYKLNGNDVRFKVEIPAELAAQYACCRDAATEVIRCVHRQIVERLADQVLRDCAGKLVRLGGVR